jgi:hypothetical protein
LEGLTNQAEALSSDKEEIRKKFKNLLAACFPAS